MHTELVTGVSGLVGGGIAAELTAQGHHVTALIRGARSRMPRVRAWVAALGGDPDHLTGLDGPALGLDPSAIRGLGKVRRVFHAGGRFTWNLGFAAAARTNRDGLLELVMLTRHMPALQRFVTIGGYRGTGPVWRDVPGARADPIDDMRRYHGPYAASKVDALHALRRAVAARGIPSTVMHPGDVIGDSRSGVTNQLTGVGAMAQLIHRGRLVARPGSRRAWIPMVTVDHLARLTVAASSSCQAAGREYFVLDDATPSLHDLVDRIAAVYGRAPPSMTLPMWLVRLLPSAITGVAAESLAFISEQRYPTEPTRELETALGIEAPPIELAIERWLRFLTRCGFSPEREDWRRYRAAYRSHANGAAMTKQVNVPLTKSSATSRRG